MKKLLSIAALITLGFSYTTISPYGSFIHYSDKTVKDKAYDGGVYLSCFKSPFKIEIDGEYLDLKYKNSSNINDYLEKDLTLIGNYFIGFNYKIKAGIRNMYINQKYNNDSYDKVLIAGILYYKYLKYNMGIDYYYSTYDGFHVNQITPHFGINFGNYYSNIGSFYLNTSINFIKISDKVVANTPDDSYINTDISLTNYKGPWATTIKTSLGKNTYKVANGGFVVYNLGEEYHYSYGLDISYKINKKSSLKIGFNRSKFEENNKNAFSNVYVASFTYNF